MAEPDRGGFWTSLPGVLTGIAAVITALTAGWLAFGHAQPAPLPAVVANTTSDRASVAAPAAEVSGSAQPLPVSNLIAAANGGTLVLSGSANWDKMIDGDDDTAAQIGEHTGDFGVFGFRDGRMARIEAFTMMVPGASPSNPTAIELSYSSGSSDGPFTSLGVFPVSNGRVPPDGRQVVRFAPVVARFLKVKLRETQGGSPYAIATEFGALGTLK